MRSPAENEAVAERLPPGSAPAARARGPRRRPAGLLGAFARDRRGASAVEFALLMVPFIGMLGAILQTALVLWAGQNFDHALQKAVRSMLVGDFQNANAGTTSATTLLGNLKANLCGASSVNKLVLFDCSGVKLDVAVAGSFAGTTTPNPVSNGAWTTNFGTNYACADPGTIVVVTAAVKFPIAFGLINPTMKTFSDGTRMLLSTAVFRTEPYQPTNGTSSC